MSTQATLQATRLILEDEDTLLLLEELFSELSGTSLSLEAVEKLCSTLQGFVFDLTDEQDEAIDFAEVDLIDLGVVLNEHVGGAPSWLNTISNQGTGSPPTT